ncbi:diguanylate phosphodiesterase [Desulfosarcina alkanivorans]|uniref:Diguanylate phosphodiesterase n=1 Tax=Desulfosarcina alkanivorans TaxID=571177 RepID=A0A5K7YWS3_9BACT|nr:ABC transporter substrate-binding protein [Desulfosarcina alkanivorans]BBO69137.1 diguanylate phosphodiesterase [Desulfosarcina alkanivorans]
MKKKSRISLLLMVVFISGSLIHSAVAASPDQRGNHRNVLRFGVHVSEMGNLDPHFAAGSQDRALADMVFNGLLRYLPGNVPKIEPDLAVRVPGFEMIGGRQVWTVRLRKGVWFHAGPQTEAYELTAEDVVFSLRKSASREFCAYAGEYEGMTVVPVDRYTVRITVEKPVSSILFLPKLTNYAGGFIVSKRAIDSMGYEGFKQHPVGTGPFVFSGYTPGEKLVLAAHDHYFRGRPQIDGVQIRFIPDIGARETGLTSGELDVIIGSGEKGWPEKMAGQPGIAVDTHGVGEVATIYLNTRMKPLDDIRVRRAIALALNREAFLDTMSKQLAGSVFSPVPARFLPGGLTKTDAEILDLTYSQNLARARDLMADAGYPDGFALDLVSSEKRLYRTYYREMGRQLSRIGIRCRIAVETHSTMHKLIRRSPRPIVIYVAWRPNADAYLSRFFHSDAIILTGARPDTNFSSYDKVDRLIEAARLEIDPERQIQLWVQAQIRILDDMAAFPIMYSKQCYARRTIVNYGHSLVSTMALYPQFTENTRLKRNH